MTPGTVILLNGASSAGKTTLAHTLQRFLPIPAQHLSLDQFRDGLPDGLRGMNAPEGTSGALGLNVVPGEDEGEPLTHICFGSVGRQVKRAMRRSVAALAAEGLGVVVDDLLLEREDLLDYAQVLAPFPTYLVAVHAPLPVLTAREAARPGRFPGTARSHHKQVHGHGHRYDVEVDTSVLEPAAAAQEVLAVLAAPPEALAQFRLLEGLS